MKKIYLMTLLAFSSLLSSAQTNVLCENFTNYAPDSINYASFEHYNGWYFSYFLRFSFYTSQSSSGVSGPNSYKFGVDSATAITPNILGADHFNFWMKGNSTDTLSTLYIYQTNDSINWNLITAINRITADTIIRQYSLSPGAKHVKFFYDKSTGNVAFDDFCATIGSVGISSPGPRLNMRVYPNPTSGNLYIDLGQFNSNSVQISIANVLGSEVKRSVVNGYSNELAIDLGDLNAGIYMVTVKTDLGSSTQRVVVRK